MKKILLTLMVFGIVGCSKEIPSDQLVERNGITYEVNSQTPFSGRVVSYHENGQLQSKRNYKDGCLEGLQESYYENGQLEEKGIYKDIMDIPMFCSNQLDYGFYDGPYESYYKNGQLKKKENYKDGIIEDGPVEEYYSNGQLSWGRNYKDGTYDGLSESYHANGQLNRRDCYKNGKKVDMSYCEK